MRISDVVAKRSSLLANYKGGCATCPRKRVDFVPGTKGKDPMIIFVGEAPGATEVDQQEGFVGESGQILRNSARDNGITNYALSNIVHCRPPKNKTPTAREIACCMTMLTIEEVRGYPVVVLCGSIAQHAFFPGIATNRLLGNFVLHPDYPGQRFYSIYHPAYMLGGRRPDLLPRFHELMARLARYLRGDRPKMRLVTPADADFGAQVDSLMKERRLGLDVESNKKPLWHPEFRIRSLAFAARPDLVVGCHEDHPAFVSVLDRIARWLEKPSHVPVGHNIGFDLNAVEVECQIVARCRIQIDTMALSYQARMKPETNLKELVSEELDGYENLVVDPGNEDDLDALLEYNAEDTVYPLQLADKLIPAMPASTRDLFVNVAGRQSLLYSRMQTEGVYLRMEVWQELKQRVDQSIAKNFEEWRQSDRRFPGPQERQDKKTGFKVYSLPDTVLEDYLFNRLKLPVLGTTKSGKAAVDEEMVKKLMNDHGAPQLKYLLEFRRLDKERSTYIDPLPGLVQADGRIHPRYVFDTTDTGRRSCREPNYMNQPRTDVRRMWGAQQGIFMQADFSQIELRIAVSLANSLPAIQKYNQGIDLHTQMAQAFIGTDRAPTKEERTNAKSVNFALVYGGSWQQLQRQAWNDYGVTLTDQEAQTLRALFFNQVVPGLSIWHSQCAGELAQQQGYGIQIMGHQHYYNGWDSLHEATKAHVLNSYINSRCQGPAAYIACHTMLHAQQEVKERGLPIRFVGDVHDAMHLEIESQHFVDEAADIIRHSVQNTHKYIASWFKVPLLVDIEVGPSWWELKKL